MRRCFTHPHQRADVSGRARQNMLGQFGQMRADAHRHRRRMSQLHSGRTLFKMHRLAWNRKTNILSQIRVRHILIRRRYALRSSAHRRAAHGFAQQGQCYAQCQAAKQSRPHENSGWRPAFLFWRCRARDQSRIIGIKPLRLLRCLGLG